MKSKQATKKETDENRSPNLSKRNIGDLKPSRKKSLARQYTMKQLLEQKRTQEIQKQEEIQKEKQQVIQPFPMATRDPSRVPLQNRQPLTTTTHRPPQKIYFADSESTISNVHSQSDASNIHPGKKRNSKSNNRLLDLDTTKENIALAYASKDSESGLLQVSLRHPKTSLDVDFGNDSSNDDNVVYPIAINGGGVGVFSGKDFAHGTGIHASSFNAHHSNLNMVKSVVAFPWNFGNGTFSDEKKKKEKFLSGKDGSNKLSRSKRVGGSAICDEFDLEAGVTFDTDDDSTCPLGNENRQKKLWNKTLESVTNVGDISHALGRRNAVRTLPNTVRKKFTRQSGMYNEDDFDYAIILQPSKEFHDCAENLDFSKEYNVSIFDRAWNQERSPMKQVSKTPNKRRSSNKPASKYRSKVTPRMTIHAPRVKSAKKKTPKPSSVFRRSAVSSSEKRNQHLTEITESSNVLDINDIPNPAIPRGLAKVQAFEDFLGALQLGFVVRRHVPGHDPVFVKLYSNNGGDTIHFEYVEPDEAKIAIKSQIEHYNHFDPDDEDNDVKSCRGINDKDGPIVSDWAPKIRSKQKGLAQFEEGSYKRYREQHLKDGRNSSFGGFVDTISVFAKKLKLSGHFKVQHLVHVQRATHKRSFSCPDPSKGSLTLQECNEMINRRYLRDTEALQKKYDIQSELDEEQEKLIAKYKLMRPVKTRTFSIVVPSTMAHFHSIAEYEEKYESAEISPKQFSFLDFETASDGEYWMLFRGFLQLNRDAKNNRFAKERARGFGCRSNNKGMIQDDSKIKNDETLMKKEVPPPDFYLGNSLGTQVWSRLRMAGLETERIFDLDTKNVMLQIRCPKDRLLDVAEVLGIKLKKKDGGFAAFKEDMADIFMKSDVFGGFKGNYEFFRSALRQHIIDYIINTHVRDTGAGLSYRFDVARKGIKIRSPLHMHANLEDLFKTWFRFWSEDTWKKISKENDFHLDSEGEELKGHDDEEIPARINRIFRGMFYQPLDSIEEYYGEKVAFYFAWMQHSSLQLILPSILGVAVSIWQVFTQRWENNEILPFFSTFIMVWSFYVMTSWKQRQNDLTHRWGSMNFTQDETPRPQFYGEYRAPKRRGKTDFQIDEKQSELVYPSWKRWIKYSISFPLVIIFTVIAFLGIIMIYSNRDIMLAKYFGDPNQDLEDLFKLRWNLDIIGKAEAIVAVDLSSDHLHNPRFWWTVGFFPCLIGLSIPLLNFLLMRLSTFLNNIENHKTESHYRNALIAKVIAFRFVAYFSALYYYAYMAAERVINGGNENDVKNAFLRIATSLVIYLTVQHWWSLFLQVYIPLKLQRYRKDKREAQMKVEGNILADMKDKYSHDATLEMSEISALGKKIANKQILLEQGSSQLWEELSLPDYNPFFDYIQSIVYFAYVTCFSTVFPLTPLFVLINQLINVRLHAYKICRVRRRPLAQKTGGIAVWEHVLHLVTLIGVFTNCSLMVITNAFFDFVKDSERYSEHKNLILLGIFIVWERTMVTIRDCIKFFTPEKSKRLRRKLQEEELTRNKELTDTMKEKRKEKKLSGVSATSSINLSPQRSEVKPKEKSSRKSSKIGGKPKSSRRIKRAKAGSKAQKKTPRTKLSSAVRVQETTNSPFSLFIPKRDEITTPLIHYTSDDEVSKNISDILSLDSEDSVKEYTRFTPSMKKSISKHREEEENKAAKKRIKARLSG